MKNVKLIVRASIAHNIDSLFQNRQKKQSLSIQIKNIQK